ncbi:UDP-N-acetylmuramoyl-L-alanyl-D-glutamate--L-lysine ligase [Streptococcus pseudoporcinus]|uniref:UDP-N-acetylmuramoyl-L-alanyl-D-glutamate--L-lysine ligase n=2 Tax=Streptococcus pseudoporcinus TaxID=361101 RepID=A0A4U9Y156_9STRE|nr:UDP-N-acetylmuramoyl-L-alanyl-D-glutamate--L-lysine ligase [Streptococcus pseudoporcinus]VTS18741.1 UDP-N-acetylmuramoylalanyl-D-glutamate--L-lysine ligase [Streptococcus pseudoporcinus]VUC68698.1 UDP-N-acetylmuramoylalanyl-D-glutamate--L-lysine ligase [Streptococcus pseudoporcinus]VUC99397.1 UDP-N-acetylmuramoylalanyl-D-glutamate--L-lysine ligase [Streptococcus pseudoporcinus]VUC99789.1 UDP-N-acetylmuramoylalanyl-D-glutamate--L-lysine ligase [Streptococcus pseudoporcinus]
MIRIETIIDLLKADKNFREVIADDSYYYHYTGLNFAKLSYDSRDVDDQTLFFVKGANFKAEYLQSALEQGLPAYISEVDYEVDIPAIIVNDIKHAMSIIAMAFYDNPQDNLKLLAFTGTKGKTTSAYFAYHILKQSHKTAMLSTMNTTLDGQTFFKSQLTTPESLDLFKMMAECVSNGMTHLIMEVSSQAYLVGRVYGLTFDVGVFLNISPDHIGPIEHPTFEDYFYHKRLLMENSRAVIINSDMDYFKILKEQVKNQEHDFYGQASDNHILDSQAFTFKVTGKLAGSYKTLLIGRFNQDNALAAGLACLRLGANSDDIQKGISETTVPGRMEVLSHPCGAKVFVDYAHNGDSLEKLVSVVEEHQKGQIILIIGSTGNKGESRRADFAKVINNHPNLSVILTADDPNFEDPQTISEEIASYVSRQLTIEVDREQAIKLGLQLCRKEGDALIIAGKGADAYQIINGKKRDYAGDYTIAKAFMETSN